MRMEQQAAAIRAEVSRIEGRRGRGKAYPAALRAKAVSYWDARRTQGASQRDIGFELGISWQTLQRWATQPCAMPLLPVQPPDFERVEVVDVRVSPPRRGPLLVRGPAGLVIEGLDLDTLVELVRRLS